jgi:hypothetical protein
MRLREYNFLLISPFPSSLFLSLFPLLFPSLFFSSFLYCFLHRNEKIACRRGRHHQSSPVTPQSVESDEAWLACTIPVQFTKFNTLIKVKTPNTGNTRYTKYTLWCSFDVSRHVSNYSSTGINSLLKLMKINSFVFS